MDLQENSGLGDPKSWLSGEVGDASGVSTGTGGNLDRVLFNDLVEIVPLVQSLIVITYLSYCVQFWGFWRAEPEKRLLVHQLYIEV